MTTLEKAARALLEAIENSQHAFGGEGTLATAREAAAAALSAALLDPSDEDIKHVAAQLALCAVASAADGDELFIDMAGTALRAYGLKVLGRSE